MMNTKLLMTVSALFLGGLGMFISFLPEEISIYLGMSTGIFTQLLLQIIGALFMGFGMLNWMIRDALMGGIYNKPIVIGNLMHFVVTTLALTRSLYKEQQHFEIVLLLTIVYGFFAVAFFFLFRRNPKSVSNK
ncbi:MAG: hypothetical protein JKX68_04905 [Flavobacteriales bacterium]|nr:hypothetical protein [Flavobacteriales bacterium]